LIITSKKQILTLDDYQREARRTAIYPDKGFNLIYTVMGLCGEAGELANKVKKIMRTKGLEPGVRLSDVADVNVLSSLEGELGDILWYVSQCATELHIDLNQIGRDNLEELSGRVKRGNVEGEGDDRGKN